MNIRHYILTGLDEISAGEARQAALAANSDMLNYESSKGTRFRSKYYQLMHKYPNMSDARKKMLTDYGKKHFYIGNLQKRDRQWHKFKKYSGEKFAELQKRYAETGSLNDDNDSGGVE